MSGCVIRTRQNSTINVQTDYDEVKKRLGLADRAQQHIGHPVEAYIEIMNDDGQRVLIAVPEVAFVREYRSRSGT